MQLVSVIASQKNNSRGTFVKSNLPASITKKLRIYYIIHDFICLRVSVRTTMNDYMTHEETSFG